MLNIVGYVAGVILCLNILPQIKKAHDTKKTEDISIYFLCLNIVGLTLYSIYGFILHLYPIAIPSTISGCLSLVLLKLKCQYG